MFKKYYIVLLCLVVISLCTWLCVLVYFITTRNKVNNMTDDFIAEGTESSESVVEDTYVYTTEESEVPFVHDSSADFIEEAEFIPATLADTEEFEIDCPDEQAQQEILNWIADIRCCLGGSSNDIKYIGYSVTHNEYYFTLADPNLDECIVVTYDQGLCMTTEEISIEEAESRIAGLS